LAELCPGEDDQLIDLAGDSGAVGRMVVAGEQGEEYRILSRLETLS